MSLNNEIPFPEKLKAYLTSRNTIKNFIGLALGALGGYIYYVTIGCTSGTCAITSNPYMSVLWGGIMGYLVADIFKLKEKPLETSSREQSEQ